jgi:hypothetical protein
MLKFTSLIFAMIAGPVICFVTLISKEYMLGLGCFSVLTALVYRACDSN